MIASVEFGEGEKVGAIAALARVCVFVNDAGRLRIPVFYLSE